MLHKDYVINFISNKISEGYSSEQLIDMLDLKEKSIWAITKVLNTNKKWGQILTFIDVIDIYKDGFTFSEIAWLKGVTQEAVRITIQNSSREDFNELKAISRNKRNKMRDIILYDITVGESLRTDKETAYLKSGYKLNVFNRVYRESRKWKELIDSQTNIDSHSIDSHENIIEIEEVD